MSSKLFIWSSLLVILLLAFALLLQNTQGRYGGEAEYSKASVVEEVLHQDSFIQYTSYQITLVDEYLCGTRDTKNTTMFAPSVAAVVKSFPEYRLQKKEENQEHIFMIREYPTFHPDMEDNLYISLNAKNELVLYHGNDNVDNPKKIFFPLEQTALEELLPLEQLQRLQEGIFIETVGDYYSMLSTYSEYIIDFPYYYPVLETQFQE